MKLCCECRRKPWPYLIVVFLSGFAAFLSWLTFGAAGIDPDLGRWLSAAAFLAVGIVLLSYMFSCMSRHCSDDEHSH